MVMIVRMIAINALQGNADKGSDARVQQKPVMSRGLLAASDASRDAQRKLPSSLVSAIQASAPDWIA